MAVYISPLLWFLYISLTCALLISSTSSLDVRKSYIVYMGDQPKGEASVTSIHLRMIQNVTGRNFAPEYLLHSFKRTFNGFVVKLTDSEAHEIAGMTGVVSVFPNGKKKLHTTRSWDFMGFPQAVERATIESDIIIGVLDTGIWPESESFKDQGFGPPPSKWKGTCQVSSNFTCNNKIIGARYYRNDGDFDTADYQSPRDSNGHGSHTASIAAGGLVSMASLYDLALGTARGGVPSARVAVYKICWLDGCYDADILAAFDDAISDGVDIISLSVGGGPNQYFRDSIAIGSFHAMKNGILTSTSAGNDGPDLETIENFSPWSLSVAASTIDRKFLTKVELGNNNIYEGVSINTFDLKKTMYPLIYGGDAPNASANYTASFSRYCSRNTLDANLVKGKIVLCDYSTRGYGPLSAGAAGMVIQDTGHKDYAISFLLPASYIGLEESTGLVSYMNSTSNATATIYKSNEINDTYAPYAVSFSSRGPNPVTPEVLKPDIAAPGVDILAAWSLATSLTKAEEDNRKVPFNIVSGTSMACPHATGAAAYVKSYHPTWSPSAIKSALMTTAYPMSSSINLEAEFAYGAGHINPLKAINPGLIYDAEPIDYINYLCGLGYTTQLLQVITGDNSSCSEATKIVAKDLNCPSFVLSTTPLKPINQAFTRTVTNVGSPVSTYNYKIIAPQGLKIEADPKILSFTSLGQKLSFVLKIEGTIRASIASGTLVWDDGTHQVRSPIIIYVKF